MATPKLDTMSLMFRRHPQVSDLHNPATDALITTAAVDGNWTVAEVTEFVVHGINRLLAESYTALIGKTGSMEQAGEQMHQVFSEYVTRLTIAHASGSTLQEITATLPSDYVGPVAASVVALGTASRPRRVRFVSPRYIESARTGLYPELTSLLGMFRDGKLTVFDPTNSPAVNLAALTDHIELEYVCSQPSVTQGGATDVKLRETWFQNVVNLAVTLIHTET